MTQEIIVSESPHEAGLPAQRFQLSPDVLMQRLGEEVLLISMASDRIYQLNETAGRLLELICAGQSPAAAKQTLLEEFDVDDRQVTGETQALITSLTREGLIVAEGQE